MTTMETPSLRLRVIGAVMIIWVVLVLSLDVFVYVSLRSQLLESLDELLETRAQLALELGQNMTPAELDARLTELGVPAIVVDGEGNRLTSEPAVPGFGTGPPAPGEGLREPVVERQVVLDDDVTVTVLASQVGVERTMDQVLLIEIIGTVAVLALMMILLIRASRVVLGPIDQVVATARQIASGRTGKRLHPDRPDTELGQMAVAFDEMLDSLELAIEQSQHAAAEARESELRSRRFLADAAHQLRTPIAALRASVEALLRTEDPQERERLMDHLARETARVGRLVNGLLRVAEIDRGEGVALAIVDISEIVATEVDRAQTLSPNLRFELHTEGPTVVLADPAGLAEAFANVLDNARRHADTYIRVRVSAAGPEVVTAIEDDGPGVDEELTDRIFDRFTSFDDRGGSGLGLAITRGIIENHRGAVVYEDGRFVIRIPRGSELDVDLVQERDPAVGVH